MRAFLKPIWSARKAVCFYLVLLAGGWLLGDAVRDVALPELRPMNEPMIHRIVTIALIAFVVAAAIPFVPGAEIGFALLILFGEQAAPVVYVGMVVALMLSHTLARAIPINYVIVAMRWLGLNRISMFMDNFKSVASSNKIEEIIQRTPSKFGRIVINNRYFALAILLNTPDNTIIGGGGGLAFIAGLSGVYNYWLFLITVLCAVLPIPLFYLLI